MEKSLSLSGVSFAYENGQQAVAGVSLRLEPGEKVAVLGANGAGKSTLYRLLTGLSRPQEGEVCLDGQPIRYQNKALRELRSRVGLVFQDPDLQLFSATVEQEVSFGALNLGLPVEEAARRTKDALERMDIEDLAARPVHFLSFGQKKRVSLAAMLVMQSEYLLLDEPTAGLDPVNIERMTNSLDVLWRSGRCVAASTHDVDWAYQWAQRVILVCHGKIVFDGGVAEAFLDEQRLEMTGLQCPTLLSIAVRLHKQGRWDGPWPRSMEALVAGL